MIDATIDLHRFTEVQPRTDPRVRTGMLMMAGVGLAIAAIAAIVSMASIDVHILAVRLLADAIVLLTLVGYISLSTRSAVAQLRQQIVADIVGQVSAVVAHRVVNAIEGEATRAYAAGREDRGANVRLTALVEGQAALTKELARQRGQINLGLETLTEAVERVETFVKADIGVAYDLGAQSTRD